MTEEPEESQEQPEGEKTEPTEQVKPEHPPQVVEIHTPLDRPEFDWFIDRFMEKLGLTDKKQTAIMLTNMFYDMGLDPYADLQDVQKAMQEMNALLKQLPNTPTAMKVKDTLGGTMAARAGRTMLQMMPKVRGTDPMMDRMERILDKYAPMIMGMRTMAEMMRQDYNPPTRQTQEDPAMKQEVNMLKESVLGLKETFRSMLETQKEKSLMDNITKQTMSQLAPLQTQIQAIQDQLSAIAQKQTQPTEGASTSELNEISRNLKEAVDKLGEKAGAKALTVADVDPLLNLLERLEKYAKKEPAGEFDWRTATVSTLGEIGTEAIKAVKEIESAKAGGGGIETSTAGVTVQTPKNPEMQAIIKRQVQNYVMQRMKAGATTMNIQEAASTLGLTPQQVMWAYQTLMSEGWIHVKTPQTRRKGTSHEETTTQEGETEQTNQQPFIET